MTAAELLSLVGLGLLGIVLVLGVVATLAASLFGDRARALGHEVEAGCRPFALWWGGWPATFGLLDTEARLSRKDRRLRLLYLGVVWINRVNLLALIAAIIASVAGYVLAS